MPLTCSGASQSAQWLVGTDFLVMFVTYSSIPSDIAGGKASSFVAWMKRTGMSTVFLVSLRESVDRICEIRKWV